MRRWLGRAGVSAKRNHSRGRDWSEYGKQEPKVYPRYVNPPEWFDWEFWPFGAVKPTKGRFGILRSPIQPGVTTPLVGHIRVAIVGYQVRRVISHARAKHLPFRPWRVERPTFLDNQTYPFEFYPSGQRSFASQQGWV